jgi:hypothetical protein
MRRGLELLLDERNNLIFPNQRHRLICHLACGLSWIVAKGQASRGVSPGDPPTAFGFSPVVIQLFGVKTGRGGRFADVLQPLTQLAVTVATGGHGGFDLLATRGQRASDPIGIFTDMLEASRSTHAA